MIFIKPKESAIAFPCAIMYRIHMKWSQKFTKSKKYLNILPLVNSLLFIPLFHNNIFRYRVQNTTISLLWKDNEYYAQVRYQQFKIVDFLSYVGGILGLFAGISVLSIVEFFYFFTLRLMSDLCRYLL
ncbi:hypothetical protein ACKWTF_008881 [Chironomus riparius]